MTEQKKQTGINAEYFGIESQYHMVMEECAELIQAINKQLRAQNTRYQPVRNQDKTEILDDIYQELADVFIVSYGLQHLLSIDDNNAKDRINHWINYKLTRTKNIIADHKE